MITTIAPIIAITIIKIKIGLPVLNKLCPKVPLVALWWVALVALVALVTLPVLLMLLLPDVILLVVFVPSSW